MHLKSLHLSKFKFSSPLSSAKSTRESRGKPAQTTARPPKAAKSVKLTVKGFFQKLFSTPAKARTEVSPTLQWEGLDPNGEFKSVVAILQMHKDMNAGVYVEPPEVVQEPEILPHIPSRTELVDALKDSMQELLEDMLEQEEAERTCDVQGGQLTAYIITSDKGPVLHVHDELGQRSKGHMALYATLSSGMLSMNHTEVNEWEGNDSKLKQAKQKVNCLFELA